MSDTKKLFLIDGHAIAYRAHYAFINRPLINSKGINTSAITGFVRTLWDIIKSHNPTHIAVAFDPSGPTFRHELFPEYKANRDAQPEDISIALPYMHKIVKAFNIPVVTLPSYEADDVIGTLSKQAEKEGFTVYMVTPDKDYAQLVSDNIFMYKPSRKGNGVDILGKKEVLEKYDIDDPLQIIDLLGMQGDSSDNIPGIPGIGPKTASKLLKKYGSLEALLANTDQLKGKQREKVESYAEQGKLSKVLATIKLDVPIEFNADIYQLENFDREALKALFDELEFRTIAQQILGTQETPDNSSVNHQPTLFSQKEIAKTQATSPDPASAYESLEDKKHDYSLVTKTEDIQKLAQQLAQQKVICFDTETTGLDPHKDKIVGIAFSWQPHTGYYVPIAQDMAEGATQLAPFKKVLESNQIVKVGQNLKFDINFLHRYDIDVQLPYFDTMIAHYLLEPDLRHKLDYLTESYLNYKMMPIQALIGKKGAKQKNMGALPPEKIVDYAAEDADLTLRLKSVFTPKLEAEKLTELFDDIEMPLVRVLSKMEIAGVKINSQFLKDYSLELEAHIIAQQEKIHKMAGTPFNIASPKQVGEVLFDHLKIPYRWRKTKTGQYSTNVDKLEELSKDHEIISEILEYRKYTKLKSTYVDALPALVNARTGRIHSAFNQARAATGRLSSEHPNLQNIPIRDEAGRNIRKAFVPTDNDHVLMASDYSQIELRLIADLSKEPNMLSAFQQGLDIHSATAAAVYNVPLEEVTPTQRRNAKTVNFSIIYGAGSTNLSRQLDISRAEATELISQYYEQYKGLKKYMDEVVNEAREKGYVTTLLGRRRHLRDINSRNSLARSNAERMAINTPIQGTAADMIKIAMIRIYDQMESQKFKSKMIMQVHDELVFDVYKPELEALQNIVETTMKEAIPNLEVPIIVETGVGQNWLEAH